MLYIIRHGKTDWNNERKLQGRTDIPLNEEGIEMARRARDEYRNVPFDICYCSPLKRARQTADILLEGRNIPIITDDRLLEMSFGIYEGMANGYDDPDLYVSRLFRDPAGFTERLEGGESLDDLFERTGDFLESIVKPLLSQNKNVLIVGHGAMNSSIVSRIRGMERKDFWAAGIENCKLMELGDRI